jgi:hypothetical protein
MESQRTLEKEIQEAYKKIQEIWNSGEKAQKFILHLIHAYIPIDQSDYAIGTDKPCAIMGCSFPRLEEITDLSISRMKNAFTQDEKINKEIEQKRLDLVSKNKIPEGWSIEAIKQFKSDKSDKPICIAALIALRDFSINEMFRDNKKIEYAIHQKQIKKSFSELSPKEIKVGAKKMSGMHTTLADNEVLLNLKKKFEEESKKE